MEGAVTNITPSPLKIVQPTFTGSGASGSSHNEHLNGRKRRSEGIDKVTLSPASRDQQGNASSSERASGTGTGATGELTTAEQTQLRQLKSRDLEVKTHEQAHMAAAGQYAASGASFTYQRGPDGNRYAVGGEVQIDIGKESTPEETIQKMETIGRAALAPANPSPADRQIAAQAAMKASQARQELLQQDQDESSTVQDQEKNSDDTTAPEAGRQAAIEPLDPDVAGSATLKTMIESYQTILAMR
ncbi:putative metalloprotease CJM1_0395 family protein [Desulfopila sp. IMCC35008]|uniref:putative metalloprotease CJM1_0395 family protein n=1 Tax=Desulfopila sp. IMCC35008 TaxID=2653858 RepID=UPI0013D3EC75|nr:putative metalloprotease CJM1_0395 family protein [Desulfopila sp. IMCC35008]